jgi:CheY-like chemotaxis protein
MGLECLLVTCDPALLGQFQTSLGSHGASLQLRQDSASAIELASRRHLDGLIIDCDGVPGGVQALAQVRSTLANKQTPILAIVDGITTSEAALDAGANFVLSKPIQQSRLASVLPIAIAKMEREHRRYFRYDVDLSVRLQDPLGQAFSATMKNVSEGGMAIRLANPVKLKGVVMVEFDLPSVEPQPFHAKADVIWCDSFVAGLRFLYIDKESEVALQGWLESLESRFRFRELAQRT